MREKLKNRRKEKGYTQESFAAKINISVKTIRHIEQGIRFPRESLLKKIMNVLNITDLTTFDNIEKKDRGDVSKAICEYMNDLSKDNKRYSAEVIRAIRASIVRELEDRKKNKIQIKSYSRKGKWEIYARVASIANKEFEVKVTDEDVCLYKKCTRLEYENRTGKTTWGIPEERKRHGCSNKTGKIIDV